ncbi:MAG: TlyA family RNA methyltransferase [Microbacterium sp.]|nr:TlyA family RNA methyltransferase [Microbacterium sp.]
MTRLDVALARRGLARSRAHAAQLISRGSVLVDGDPEAKPAAQVDDDSELVVTEPDRWVSRAAHKLVAALDGFGIDPAGRLALDVGASTGGFSQVLLERGAAQVLAIEVGHDQLAPRLRGEPRLQLAEGVNARDLDAALLAQYFDITTLPSLLTADLSFISLRHVLPAFAASVCAGADAVVLIKPQFEVGRSGVRNGVVRDAGLRRRAFVQVLQAASEAGFGVFGVMSSPIIGGAGNSEYLAHLRSGAEGDPTEWMHAAATLAGA